MTDVGFITGPIGGYGQPQPTGVDEIPSTVTESMDWFQATRMLGRASQRGQMEQDLSPIPEAPAAGSGFLDTPGNLGPGFGGQGDPGQDKTFGTPEQIQQRQADTMSKDEANLRYGVDGELTFDGPTLKGVAQNLYEAKLDELRRRSIAERAPPGFFNTLTRFGANFVANFLDPLNVAAAFIPVVGEARYAEWLASAGTAAGRAGVRAGTGAVAGAVGNIPVVGLQYALSKDEQADYSAVQALTDLATGALIGGVLHVGGGFIKDRITGEYRLAAERPAVQPTLEAPPVSGLARAIDEAPAPTKEVALRSAIAAAVEGRPVEVSPLFEAAEAQQLDQLPVISRRSIALLAEEQRLQARAAELGPGKALTPAEEGAAQAAAEQLARVRQVEAQLADEALTAPERKALAARRDELLTNTTPEALQAAAAPLEQQRTATAQRESIAARLDEIAAERTRHAAAAALTSLPRIGGAVELPRIPSRETTAVPQKEGLSGPSAAGTGRQAPGDLAEGMGGPATHGGLQSIRDAVAALQRARQGIPERLQAATDRATAPPLGRPGEPLPDREDAAGQQAAAETVARPEPKEPVKAIEAKVEEDVAKLASTVASEERPKPAEKVISFKRVGEGKDGEGSMAISEEAAKAGASPEIATLEAAAKAGQLPAADLAELKAADELIQNADDLARAYRAAADCPALKDS